MTGHDHDPGPGGEPEEGFLGGLQEMVGRDVLRLDVAGTVALAAVTVLASLWTSDAANVANLVVSAVLFVGGCVAFMVGFLRAVDRSRTEVVDLAGLFYLTGSAPQPVRRAFLGLWFAQIAIATVSVFTIDPPFGVMAPLWGIGLLAVWGGRHGQFPARDASGRSRG